MTWSGVKIFPKSILSGVEEGISVPNYIVCFQCWFLVPYFLGGAEVLVLLLFHLPVRNGHGSQCLARPCESPFNFSQVRVRITEILERLANVSGYRARLTSLRDQIYEGRKTLCVPIPRTCGRI